ncbi:DUF2510 domain-containing protein [Modestobacter versicolor]|uniref:DUF2510 domain-containing protein n=1 Tax=Modestobacter versicolor TaxID=429133 RepID=A0A323VCR7_9ACTN|nr:DUF2510 domain-containing protein [Modestobacter versicolor]MBB3677646.1 hypothetical protein [Modestobacter versicolor]PZA22479.1 hypothetical protein DMO24_04775 [Modestobacter versicolor]
MTTTPAGWYPDPAGSGGQRWWDGASWGDQVQPAQQPVAAPGQPWDAAPAQPWGAAQPTGQPTGQQWGAGATGSQPWTPAAEPAGPQSFVKRNTASLIALGLVLVCVLIAATTDYIVFAFIPAIVAVQAVQKKEPLAWPALGIGIALVIWRFIA